MDENGAQFLAGSIYDVRRGALLREGAVRMVAGSVPSVNLGALASFLLTGQSSRDVKDRTREAPRGTVAPPVAAAKEAPSPRPLVEPPPIAANVAPGAAPVAPAPAATPRAPSPKPAVKTPAAKLAAAPVLGPPPASADVAHAPAAVLEDTVTDRRLALPPPSPPSRAPAARTAPRWMRPAAIGTAGAALAFAGLAVQQGLSSSSAHDRADAMLGPGGVLRPGSDPARYRDLRADGDAAARNTYVSAGVAVAFAATAGFFGWKSWGSTPAAPPALALRF
jgi:hypothetical protein